MEFFVDGHFSDFDHFAEVTRAWQLDFLQLDCGQANFQLLQAGFEGCQIARAHFNRRLRQRGGTPSGMRTFVIPATPELRLQWLGYSVEGCDLMVFPRGGELDSVSTSGFDVIVFSVSETLLENLAEQMELPSLMRLLNGRDVIRLDAESMARLRALGLGMTDELRYRGSAKGLQVRIKDELPRLLLDLLAKHRDLMGSRVNRIGSARGLKRALELIESSADEELRVKDLCVAGGVSERTLQYAFKRQFGVSPKAYLQASRLNQVRRVLTRCDESLDQVSTAANQFGFWHMGQFARDYRRMFGELPSETLQR